MTFLAPALLALGLAVAVPLALHLLQRHQGPRVVFPALRYLRRAEREHATRIRLRQLVLLALRVLAILLLAAAAARPFLPLAGGEHPPTSVVIVLDNAVSTGAVVGDRRAFDRLRDVAIGTLEAAGPDDRFWLIRAGEPWEPAVIGEASAVLDAVRRTEVAGGGSDLTGAVGRAVSILSAEPDARPREIHVLSDLRATALRPAAADDGAPPILVLAPGGSLPGIRAITGLEIGGGMAPRAGERSTVAVTLADSGGDGAGDGAAADSADVRLVMDGVVRSVARAPTEAVPVLPFPARGPGMVTGRVEVDPDILPAAARRFFAVEVRLPAAVSVTERHPFLDEALAVLEDAGRIRRSATSAADVVVAPGAAGSEVVREGRAVVVLPPTTPLELAAANQRLAAAGIPHRLGPPGAGVARLDPGGTGLDPVLDEVRLREVYEIETTGESRDSVLVRLRTGEPWAVAGSVPEGGRYVLLATPLSADASTIPTSAAMLPLLDRVLNAWARAADHHRDHRPGDVVTLVAADSVVDPDGVSAPARDGTVLRLVKPGIYRLIEADSVVAAYAVNPDAEALDLRAVDPRLLPSLLPGEDVRLIAERRWAGAIFHDRPGREASLPLVFVALLVLLVEAAVAASGRGKAREASD